MSLREEHAFIKGSGGEPFEFKVYECYSALQGFKAGEKYGRRCEATMYYEPVSRDERRGVAMLVTGQPSSGNISAATIAKLTYPEPDQSPPAAAPTASVGEDAS